MVGYLCLSLTMAITADEPLSVAVTRAQALLIVIGDPKVLSLDPLWKGFIDYVHIHGGYKGVPIDWDPKEVLDPNVNLSDLRRERSLGERNAMMMRLRADIAANVNDMQELDGNVDLPWRTHE